MVTQKCVICGLRPARNGGYCANCEARVQKERGKNGKNEQKLVKYLHYRGNVAGLLPSGNGTYKAVAVGTSLDRLPKGKVIDLDHYCEGFDRRMIKRFKKAVLQVCAA